MRIEANIILPKELLTKEEIGELVEGVAKEFVDKVQENIKLSTPTGRIYGNHQASGPGQFPAIKSGRLVNDISIDKQGLKTIVTFNAPYSEFLEDGTAKIAPRPFVAPTLKQFS